MKKHKQKLPFILRMIRGAIGKRFVIKHYSYGVIMTRYPNMKNIIPTEAQKLRRRLFKKAVKYAQSIFANPAMKEEMRRILRKPKRLFQALMKEWFKKKKEQAYINQGRIEMWRNNLNRPLSIIMPAVQHNPIKKSLRIIPLLE